MADFRTKLCCLIALGGLSAPPIPGLTQEKPVAKPAERAFVEPMVARVELRLTIGEKEVDLAIGIQEKIVECTFSPQKPLAEKLLELYRNQKPFDPDLRIEPTTESATSADATSP